MSERLRADLLVAAANAFVGLGEDGGDNRGQMVELFLREVHQPPGQPWCAAFVHHVGYWSHYNHGTRRSSWPLPPTASCWVLGEFARERGVLVERPRVGDVFLLYSTKLLRFAHTGVVVEVDAHASSAEVAVCTTIEGNTNDDGSRNGYDTLRRSRQFSVRDGHRFIRWVDLDLRMAA